MLGLTRRRLLVGGVLALVAVSLATVAFAAFTLQTTSGTVSLAVVESGTTVYICDRQEGEAAIDVTLPTGSTVRGCTADDNGGNETIFERDERLIPGETARWDIVLWNSSNSSWDLPDFNVEYPNLGTLVPVSVEETMDPGPDCPASAKPRIDASYVNQLDDTGGGAGQEGHTPPDGGAVLVPSQGYVLEPNAPTKRIPHASPLRGVWIRLRAIVDPALGNECAGNQWTVTIGWNVAAHPV